MGTSLFQRHTAVTPAAANAGCYDAHITDDWNAPVLPQGGVTTSIALRAISQELSLEPQDLRTVHTMFVGQVSPGPVQVEVRLLRRGRSMTQARAVLKNVDQSAGHEVTAAFGATRPGFEFTDISAPVVRPPEECPLFRGPLASQPDVPPSFASFWRQAECHLAQGHLLDEIYDPTTSDRVYWYRFIEPPICDDGTLDPFSVVTLCDTMPGAVFERIGPERPMFLAPSVDLTVHLFQPTSTKWLLAHNRARHAARGYASLEMALWDQDGSLVAYATQAMLFSFPDQPPVPGRRGS